MIVIKNAEIYTMAGEMINHGSVVVKDKEIKEIFSDSSKLNDYLSKNVSENTLIRVIDARGSMLLPGIIDAHCHLGMVEEGMGFEGDDLNEMTDPVTPHLRAVDAINPLDDTLREAYENGITTVSTGPGSSNVVCGQFTVMKTFGRRVDEMVLVESSAMKVALGENPKSVYGKSDKAPMTRMNIAALLRELLFETRDYVKKSEKSEDHDFDMRLHSMKPVINREIPLKVHAHRTDDMFTAIRIAREFNLRLTLDHATESHLIADYISKEEIDCVVGPSFTDRSKVELKNLTFDTPRVLYENNIRFAIMTDSPEVPIHYLPLCAGLSVKAGLPEIEALKAITINAAEILGVDKRVGSIEVGKDADLVLFSSNPLRDVTSRVLVTMIDGKIVYENLENLS